MVLAMPLLALTAAFLAPLRRSFDRGTCGCHSAVRSTGSSRSNCPVSQGLGHAQVQILDPGSAVDRPLYRGADATAWGIPRPAWASSWE